MVLDSCLVFVPNTLKNIKSACLIGLFKSGIRSNVFYVYDYMPIPPDDSEINSHSILGFVAEGKDNAHRKNRNWLSAKFHRKGDIEIYQIVINDEIVPLTACRYFIYDKESFVSSELFNEINDSSKEDYFQELACLLKEQRAHTSRYTYLQAVTNAFLSFFITFFTLVSSLCGNLFFLLKYSQFALHLQSSIDGLAWMLSSIRDERMITLQAGNYLIAILADIILGSAIVNTLTSYYEMDQIFDLISSFTQDIIQSILVIIEWLMGSPVGLKLNAPLNQIIGGFFLYHVKLWWTFIELVEPVLKYGVQVLVSLGVLGLSFQAALLLDLLVIATFHVYCIYVYAARLYGWHISGLLSLSKLVIGRKRNPIPGRVDSCPYTTEQLFVGTTSFAVLLFLLPTLLVYYVVFAFLRIGVVMICAFIINVIYYLRMVPLYSSTMWLFNSKRTAATVRLEVLRRTGMVKQYIRAVSLSWRETVCACIPSVVTPPTPLPWAELVSHLSMGKLIYPV